MSFRVGEERSVKGGDGLIFFQNLNLVSLHFINIATRRLFV
jgi:hypothetical protein